MLWSRVGRYDVADLVALQEQDRALFEYWAHEASLVLSEDWPIHEVLMRTWPAGDGVVARRHREWLAAHDDFRRHVLAALRDRGPLRAGDLHDGTTDGWDWGAWSRGRTVARLLDLLWVRGEVLVSRREAGQRLWDLADRCVPPAVRDERLDEPAAVRRAVGRSVRALGICSERDVTRYFTRGRYPGLRGVLDGLVRSGEVVPVAVEGLRLQRYAHVDSLPEIDAAARDDWQPRSVLLSPFDNLVADRRRTEELWGFRFRLEIYTPKDRRQYGYFVLPWLHGDRLVGRVDAAVDRRGGVLRLHAVHLEPPVRPTKALAAALRRTAGDLARFVGAGSVEVGAAPAGWAAPVG